MPSAFEEATTLRTTDSVRCACVFRYLLPLANDSIYSYYTSAATRRLGSRAGSGVLLGSRFPGPHDKKGKKGSGAKRGRKPNANIIAERRATYPTTPAENLFDTQLSLTEVDDA